MPLRPSLIATHRDHPAAVAARVSVHLSAILQEVTVTGDSTVPYDLILPPTREGQRANIVALISQTLP